MSKRLQLHLPLCWEDATHLYENATFTYQRKPPSTGRLQIMIAEYEGGLPPNPTERNLIEFAVGAGQENHGGQLVSTFSGANALGLFGSAVFRGTPGNQDHYYQAWFSSNGFDLIYLVFEAESPPGEEVLDETQSIVAQLGFQ